MARTTPAILVLPLLTALAAGPAAAASLRADYSSQEIQNRRADEDNLSRMEDDEMVEIWTRLELLEEIDLKTRAYYLHSIPPSGRYLRPWAKLFLERLSRQHHARFGKPLRVTSLLRTAEHQRRLQRRNGNAAGPEGPRRSVHLTGACMDISKKGMTRSQQAWVRRVLSSLRSKGYLYAIEEYKQPVFHILVHRNYDEYVEERVASADD